MEKFWIGPQEDLQLNQVGFLIEFQDSGNGREWHVLRDTPAYTNVSNQAKLTGWCGTYDNLSTFGDGMARVERVARNGRALVVRLQGNELKMALEELGYPELGEE